MMRDRIRLFRGYARIDDPKDEEHFVLLLDRFDPKCSYQSLLLLGFDPDTAGGHLRLMNHLFLRTAFVPTNRYPEWAKKWVARYGDRFWPEKAK